MEIIRRVNWVDVLVVILMIRISYVAFQQGLSHEFFPLIGSIAITVLALHYYDKIGEMLSQNLLNFLFELSNFLSFFILSLTVGFLFKLLKALLGKLVSMKLHPFIETFGGLVVGIIRASIVTSLVLINIALFPLSYLQWSIRDRSLMGMYFLKICPTIYEKAYNFLPAIRVDKTPLNKEELIKNLASDKVIASKVKKENQTPEWKKAVE